MTTSSRCSAPVEGHKGDTAAAAKCPIHGVRAVPVPTTMARPSLGQAAPVFRPIPNEPGKDPFPRYETEAHRVNGELHREDGPAIRAFDKHGELSREGWFVRGERHRVGAPAVIMFRSGGRAQKEEWCLNGIRSRSDDGPVEVTYREDGSVESQVWSLGDGEEQRFVYSEDGAISAIEKQSGVPGWGLLVHCADGPAVTKFHTDGTISSEEWISREQPWSRLGNLGPDVVNYRPDGSVESEMFAINTREQVTVKYEPDGSSVERSNLRHVACDKSGKITRIIKPDAQGGDEEIAALQRSVDEDFLHSLRGSSRNHDERLDGVLARLHERQTHALPDTEELAAMRLNALSDKSQEKVPVRPGRIPESWMERRRLDVTR